MSNTAHRSQILRNVRDGVYHSKIAREVRFEPVFFSLPCGPDLSRPLTVNLGTLLARVPIGKASR
jgi:hypothetical protein